MPDTYETSVEAEADRAQQKALLAALIGWDRALRRDECGAWRITGSRGSIHTWGEGESWALLAVGRRRTGPTRSAGLRSVASPRTAMTRVVCTCNSFLRRSRQRSFGTSWVFASGRSSAPRNWSAGEP